MIPDRRLVFLALVPVGVALAWVLVPAVLPALLGVDVVLVTLAALDAWRNTGGVEVSRHHEAIQSVGQAFEVALVVRNVGTRDLTMRVDDDGAGEAPSLPMEVVLPAGEARRVTYERTVARRGQYPFGPVAVRWRSPWGLWWAQRRVDVPGDALRVYPDVRHLRDGGLKGRQDERRMPVRVRRKPGGESEFERLRPYVPGDPYRHIDWKATARRHHFVTRQFGQEVNQNVVFLIDAGRSMTADMDGLTAFDHALNAALAMGHAALRHGDRVGLLVFDKEARAFLPPRGGTRTGARLVQATYDVFPTMHEPDFAAAFRMLQSTVRRRSLVVLLTTVLDEVNAEAATAMVGAMATRHLPLCVWLRDPRLDAMLDAPVGDREDFHRRAAAAELVGWQESAMADWRRRGALVVDARPDDLSARLLARYLEVKARRLL